MSEEKMAVLMFCGLCGFVGFVISLLCVAMVSGFLRSTHSVQYLPHEVTAPEKTDEELIAENEKALLDKVGKKQKEKPTIIEELDSHIEDIVKSDINF